jgi:cellulose synthase (UDP-forming)
MFSLIYFVFFTALLITTYKLSKKNEQDINLLGKLTLLSLLIYITWRLFFTIPANNTISIILGLILICFELLGVFQSIIMVFLFSNKNEVIINRDSPFTSFPTVDIFICTYNEPIDILKRTIISASLIKYPKKKLNVYVGDDGKRIEVKNLCKKYKVNYVTREDNTHAKAGNLNNLLKLTNGEFCLVLDADFIPKENILEKMLHYFEDTKMGFVQAPQVFYNLDLFQYNLGFNNKIPNEQDFFMRKVCKKRSNLNATLQLGTNTLFRKSALIEIGLIPTGSITEDMATGMLIQNAGYKSYFLNECVAIGLAVDNFSDYVKQRDRWARGNIQVMQMYSPFNQKNLNFKQKLIYLSGTLYWLFGLQKMVYTLFPLIYLLINVPILYTTGFNLLLFFIPSYIGSALYYRALSNNSRSLLWSNIYDTSIAPQMSFSILKELLFKSLKKLKFNVTSKGKTTTNPNFNLRVAFAHICLLLLIIASLILGFIKLAKASFLSPVFFALLTVIIWSLYNFIPVLVSIFLALEKPRFRSTERISAVLNVNKVIKKEGKILKSFYGSSVDISEIGVKIELKQNNEFDATDINKILHLQIEEVGIIKAKIVRLYKEGSREYLSAKFVKIHKKAIHKVNQMRFKKIEGYEANPNYKKQNLASLMSIVIFERFAFKN